MEEQLERQIIDLVAVDRIYVPLSSFDGKLKRRRPKLAEALNAAEEFDGSFKGERAYARVESEDKQVARGMRDGVEEFSKKFPKYGKILNGIIEEERTKRETHLYFGMNPGKRLAQDDYMAVMQDIGLSEAKAEQFYPVVMEISRNLTRKRDGEERSVMIG
jgi:hypothetical protein